MCIRDRADDGQAVFHVHVEDRPGDIALGFVARFHQLEAGFHVAADIGELARHVVGQLGELGVAACQFDAGQGRVVVVQVRRDKGVARIHDGALAVGDAAQRALELLAAVDGAGGEGTACLLYTSRCV